MEDDVYFLQFTTVEFWDRFSNLLWDIHFPSLHPTEHRFEEDEKDHLEDHAKSRHEFPPKKSTELGVERGQSAEIVETAQKGNIHAR